MLGQQLATPLDGPVRFELRTWKLLGPSVYPVGCARARPGKEGKTMLTRTSFITVCGALVGLTLTAATLSAVSNSAREYVRFSGPVGLPGVTLEGGSYIFEVLDPMGTGDVILVRSKTTYQARFLGFTRRVDRPAGLTDDQSVVLGEAPKGVAAPVLGWYPIGDSRGHEFIYKGTSHR
jgi:hypothetical protein